MERPTILEHFSALIGQTYTEADHRAVVAHLAEVSRLAQDVMALREMDHKAALAAARGEIAARAAQRERTMWGMDVPESEDAV